MDDVSAERIAENESVFRDANDRIERRARELEFGRPVPFLCECGDPSCHTIVHLTLEAYNAVRDQPTHFLVIPGHERVSAPDSRVVERHERYFVVEKEGAGGAVAARRDRRDRAR